MKYSLTFAGEKFADTTFEVDPDWGTFEVELKAAIAAQVPGAIGAIAQRAGGALGRGSWSFNAYGDNGSDDSEQARPVVASGIVWVRPVE